MSKVLLTSEKFVKEQLNISDNVAGGYLLPAIREAQDMTYTEMIGSCLVEALCRKVEEMTIDDAENLWYKDLLNRSQYFLAYQSVVNLIDKVAFKIANAGVVRTNDENVANVPMSDVIAQRNIYQGRADFYGYSLIRFLIKNSAHFPELCACDCAAMRARLEAHYTCGLNL